ncbi:MAG: thymidylate kinase [Candidatus Harrisonbacteria bacterium CG10_big_fil_rev_8_21_14_0_10_45_28]|uniref:Thymidylate kinase n=1 Tax=Candidatus Harrisonbacteria bacterium CG10_big_fil_rev_8_21_14_0_10_45_28 TaxID=1974586 RepID=A0A2H0UMA8_9BACT|nr:MAG: thymidylate kinase [Candidatus Harrisonbacteria bacterium CG10_big_fil_rev_8_21_14_0_10_45_28]
MIDRPFAFFAILSNMAKGKFIVIEGTDGSGKKTQFELLVEKLKKQGRKIETFDFPQYEKGSSWFVRNYLKGNYGELDEVGPEKASIFYAVDRLEASKEIRVALEAGKLVLSNRYVGSNLGHQGSKFENVQSRRRFFDWVFNLEYKILGVPEPDLNIILHVPAKTAQKLAMVKDRESHVNAGNEKNVRDIHEDNLSHLERAEQVYLEIAKMFPEKFKLIECAPEGEVLPRSEIHNRIWELVKGLI